MRIMAIDYGDARVGVAFSDLTATIAGDAFVIHVKSQKLLIAQIAELVAERGVEKIILGNPLNMDGTEGARTEKTKLFAEKLQKTVNVPIKLRDERRTSVDASRILHENGKHGAKNKAKTDAVAAVLILESELASMK